MKKTIYSALFVGAAILSLAQNNSDNWKTTGNTPQPGSFLGTLTNDPLEFRVNNNPLMALDALGNLKLTSLSGTGSRVILANQAGNLISLPAGLPGQFLQSNGTWASLPSGATAWQLVGNNLISTNGGNIGIGTNNPTSKLSVNGDLNVSNNVYVGGGLVTTSTVSASSKVTTGDIDVGNNLNVTGLSILNGGATFPSFAGTGSGVVFYNNTGHLFNGIPSLSCLMGSPFWSLGGDNFIPYAVPGGLVNEASIGTCNNQDFILKSNAVNKLWIKADGKIGFGISSPSSDFHFSGNGMEIDVPSVIINTNFDVSATDAFVITGSLGNPNMFNFKVKKNGTVYAREIFVTLNNFPDYVFSNDYKLMALDNCKKFIAKNHRLPNMPSAEEIQRSGANLGEVQRITVEKLEEAYLYIFQLEEKLNELNKKYEALENKLNK